MTRGDNNGTNDAEPVRELQVKGKLFYAVPYVGYAANALGNADRNLVGHPRRGRPDWLRRAPGGQGQSAAAERSIESLRRGRRVKSPAAARAALAVGAFVLTVLLGVGGASASALWQQSATATMTVTANGTWPGPAIVALSCADPSKKSVALTVTLNSTLTAAQLPATLSVAVVGSGTTYSEWTTLGTAKTGQIDLSTTHALVVGQPTGTINIRVTVTYKDNTSASISRTIVKGNGNSQVTCT